MSREYKLDFDGQSVTQTDYNDFAHRAGTEGDRVLAELFRMAPDAGTVSRAILPYGHKTSGNTPLIAPNGATGSIKVNPFRALIGSRTLEATDAALNWQDIRSGISIADGASTLATTIPLTANATGTPRWDAVYAVVTLDNPSSPVTRKVKNPGTAVVTDQSVSPYKSVTVTVTKVDGTASATPAFPAIPGDSGSIYYILLGYIRVPTGFGAGSTVDKRDVNTVAPVLTISHATGANSLRPANQQYLSTGTAITGTGTSSGTAIGANGPQAWKGTAAQRPGCYIPPSMTGTDSLLISIDLTDTTTPANWSHQNNAIVDDSRDWRNRLFKWTASVGLWVQGGVPWNGNFGVNTQVLFTSAGVTPGYGQDAFVLGVGHSFQGGLTVNQTVVALGASGAASANAPVAGFNVCTNSMATGTGVTLYVDPTTGALKVGITGLPATGIIIWLDATSQFENA